MGLRLVGSMGSISILRLVFTVRGLGLGVRGGLFHIRAVEYQNPQLQITATQTSWFRAGGVFGLGGCQWERRLFACISPIYSKSKIFPVLPLANVASDHRTDTYSHLLLLLW